MYTPNGLCQFITENTKVETKFPQQVCSVLSQLPNYMIGQLHIKGLNIDCGGQLCTFTKCSPTHLCRSSLFLWSEMCAGRVVGNRTLSLCSFCFGCCWIRWTGRIDESADRLSMWEVVDLEPDRVKSINAKKCKHVAT